jgi:predicted DNA-binding ribbon-helix-helix protein
MADTPSSESGLGRRAGANEDDETALLRRPQGCLLPVASGPSAIHWWSLATWPANCCHVLAMLSNMARSFPPCPATARTPRYQGMASTVIKRSVRLERHKTSVSLEDEFWEALKEIAPVRGMPLRGLLVSIDRTRCQDNLSSALGLFLLEFYQNQAERRASERV